MELEEKKWAALCYIPIFNIISCPLVGVRMVKSKLCRFHARQGLIVFALWVATLIVGLFSGVLSLMLWGVVLLLYVSGIVIAYNKSETRIPVLGQFADQIPEYFLFELFTGKKPEEIPDIPVSTENKKK